MCPASLLRNAGKGIQQGHLSPKTHTAEALRSSSVTSERHTCGRGGLAGVNGLEPGQVALQVSCGLKGCRCCCRLGTLMQEVRRGSLLDLACRETQHHPLSHSAMVAVLFHAHHRQVTHHLELSGRAPSVILLVSSCTGSLGTPTHAADASCWGEVQPCSL